MNSNGSRDCLELIVAGKCVPPPPEPEIPTLPVDETTGQHVKNPRSDTPDLTSQMEVEHRDPKLVAHLKAVKHGVSYPSSSNSVTSAKHARKFANCRTRKKSFATMYF